MILHNLLKKSFIDQELVMLALPALRAASSRPHVAPALQRLAGSRTGVVPPLPFLIAPPPVAPAPPPRAPAVPERIDDNLHFALLQAMVVAGQLELPAADHDDGSPEDRDDALPEEDDDELPEGGETLPHVRALLLAIPLPDAFLSELRALSWYAGCDVQRALSPDGHGEDDTFDVDHLEHLGRLASLEALDLQLARPSLDLAPLRALPMLRRLTFWARVESLAPLLDLPHLREVEIGYDETDENRAFVEHLAARGVQLTEWPPRAPQATLDD